MGVAESADDFPDGGDEYTEEDPDFPTLSAEEVVQYLEFFAYLPMDSRRWLISPGAVEVVQRAPQISLSVSGRRKDDFGRMCYTIECGMQFNHQGETNFEMTWEVLRPLGHLRDHLYVQTKKMLGDKIYSHHFAQTPFARRGGWPGTTNRLNNWCRALAHCINIGGIPPDVVALTLNFVDTPAPEDECEDFMLPALLPKSNLLPVASEGSPSSAGVSLYMESQASIQDNSDEGASIDSEQVIAAGDNGSPVLPTVYGSSVPPAIHDPSVLLEEVSPQEYHVVPIGGELHDDMVCKDDSTSAQEVLTVARLPSEGLRDPPAASPNKEDKADERSEVSPLPRVPSDDDASEPTNAMHMSTAIWATAIRPVEATV